jgi:acyl transferase domain-containing protein
MARQLVSEASYYASNHANHSLGITLPNTKSQTNNIRSLYEDAGLDPSRTAFVECHGTGTQAGDTRELEAVSKSLCLKRDINNPVFVGSVKTNIGHLEGASGIAGLIKSILTVEKGIIPRQINFETGNPAIDFENWKVKVSAGRPIPTCPQPR